MHEAQSLGNDGKWYRPRGRAQRRSTGAQRGKRFLPLDDVYGRANDASPVPGSSAVPGQLRMPTVGNNGISRTEDAGLARQSAPRFFIHPVSLRGHRDMNRWERQGRQYAPSSMKVYESRQNSEKLQVGCHEPQGSTRHGLAKRVGSAANARPEQQRDEH
jgi:hypothetical protein